MRQGSLIGPIIIAIGLIAAAVVFAIVGALLQTADGGTDLRLGRLEAELEAVNAELDNLKAAQRAAQSQAKQLDQQLGLMAGQMADQVAQARAPTPNVDLTEVQEHVPTQDMTEVMLLATERFNKGVTQPNNRIMLELLGQPRDTYDTTCRSITNPKLKALLETRQVGPLRLTLLTPALDSLERIFAQLKTAEPDIYAALGTAGGLCVRYVRGSTSSISNHSFGTAVDIKLQDTLDGFGDGGTQFGLLLLAELFNAEGWYWGATYRREDSMHFEVGEETLRRWLAEGKL